MTPKDPRGPVPLRSTDQRAATDAVKGLGGSGGELLRGSTQWVPATEQAHLIHPGDNTPKDPHRNVLHSGYVTFTICVHHPAVGTLSSSDSSDGSNNHGPSLVNAAAEAWPPSPTRNPETLKV